MEPLKLYVRDIQAEAPQGIGLNDIAEFPANRVGCDRGLQTANPFAGQHALGEPPEDAPGANVHFQNDKSVTVIPSDFKADIVHPNDLAAVDIDNLLIEKIALDPEHVFVRVVRIQFFIRELDALERDTGDLVVADGKP